MKEVKNINSFFPEEKNSKDVLFRQEVEEYVKPHKGKFNYDVILQSHLDITRFYPWVDQVNQFKSIEGRDIFCSGCGSAGDLYCFLDKGAGRAFGAEIDRGLVRLARSRLNFSPFVTKSLVILYNGGALPFKNSSFDIAFSMHVIEHVTNFAIYLSEMLRVLKRGGILFLELPNRYFPIEQHTSIPGIHYLPMLKSGSLIRFASGENVRKIVGKDLSYRISTLAGTRIPWPHTLMKVAERFKRERGLKILQAAFHSHTNQMRTFSWKAFPWALPYWGRKTTFRLVLEIP